MPISVGNYYWRSKCHEISYIFVLNNKNEQLLEPFRNMLTDYLCNKLYYLKSRVAGIKNDKLKYPLT